MAMALQFAGMTAFRTHPLGVRLRRQQQAEIHRFHFQPTELIILDSRKVLPNCHFRLLIYFNSTITKERFMNSTRVFQPLPDSESTNTLTEWNLYTFFFIVLA